MTRVWSLFLKVVLVALVATGVSMAAVVLDPDKVDRATDDHRPPLTNTNPDSTTYQPGGTSLQGAAEQNGGGSTSSSGGASGSSSGGDGASASKTPGPDKPGAGETPVATTSDQTPRLPGGRELPWSLIAVAVFLLLFAAGGGYYFYSNRDDD